jgi:hypothetical protein
MNSTNSINDFAHHLAKFFSYIIQFTAYALIAFAFISCSGGNMDTANKVTFPSIKDVPAETWEKLSQKKIYFGHQSVGNNILDGVRDVMKENPQVKLNIVETNNLADFTTPLFGHSRVGKNEDPKSKCDAFADFMDKGLGNNADIAFFKFCFVDVTSTTDSNELFKTYKATMSGIRTKYPKTIFIHMTTPILIVQTGPKAWIKKIIGRSIDGYEDNIKREQFNALLRKEFSGKEPFIDLALIESILPDGSKATFEKDGKIYPALVTAYTNDGGHLNEVGRKKVAEQLLILLASLANK